MFSQFNFSEFHFLRPDWFWALLPFFILFVLWYRQRLASGNWMTICDEQLLPHILEYGEGRISRWPLILFSTVSVVSIVALAGPTWQKLPMPVFRNESALVIVLDLSRSMDAADIKPSRLQRARFKITDILQQRKEGLTALIVYGANAFTVAPLTDDTETISNQLSALESSIIPVQGSHASLALQQAESLLEQSGTQSGNILLITDGLDSNAAQTAKELNTNSHTLFVLGVGTRDGAPISQASGGFVKDSRGNIVVPKLPSVALQSLAKQGGGIYQEITTDDRDIRLLIDAFSSQPEADQQEQNLSHIDQWIETGPWLILFILPIAALAFRRGYLAVLLCCFLSLPESAFAQQWKDLWRTPDQQGYSAFQRGDIDEARKKFENSEWRAASEYASGNYKSSLAALQGMDAAGSAYNRGNVLARMGNFPEAIKEYQSALLKNPQNKDARYNKELIEKLMQEQESSQDKSQKSGENSRQDEDSESNDTDSSSENNQQSEQQGGKQDQTSSESDRDSESKQNPEQASHSDENESDKHDQTDEAESIQQPDSTQSEEGKDENAAVQQADVDEQATEIQEANEQWLRRIPDDPGGLLRRKFKYQYKQRNSRRDAVSDAW